MDGTTAASVDGMTTASDATRTERATSVSRSRARRTKAGFTLVELGAVVVIIGILAVLALVGYRRYIRNSKVTEAQNLISAIKIAQEDFRAERGIYADIGPNYCPLNAGQYDKKVGWDPDCAGGGAMANPTWRSLPVHFDGAVQFKYATRAGTAAYAAGDANWVTGTPVLSAGQPWFVITATCDLDGQTGNDTQLATMSFTNQIFARNEGQ